MKETQAEKIVKLVKNDGILRCRDLKKYNLHSESLRRLVKEGFVERIGRGLYRLSNEENASIYCSFAETAKRIPQGVVCLLSALYFHQITTQIPFQIWIAIGEKDRIPKTNHLSIRFVRFSKELLTEGIRIQHVEGVPIKITNPAKTIADCFKYRNKIGLDVALEALRDGLKQRKCTRDELWHYAKICRVTNVIRPYLEAMS